MCNVKNTRFCNSSIWVPTLQVCIVKGKITIIPLTKVADYLREVIQGLRDDHILLVVANTTSFKKPGDRLKNNNPLKFQIVF